MSKKEIYTEDTYLRKQVGGVIAMQKSGKIVLSPAGQNYGILTIDELGGDLVRAHYPYDYAVGTVGYLAYDGQSRLYVYTAISGEKLPKALENYKEVRLFEAELDYAKRTITINLEAETITFTGVNVSQNGYELLCELNKELMKKNAAVVVWKVWKGESQSTVPHLFPDGVPHVANDQTRLSVTGYAYDPEDNALVYLGAIGYKTSVESVRATLLIGPKRIISG